jgi:hypothetical protein
VVKLNGGLGTSMGLAGPKSLLEVRPGMSFLDVVATQVLALRERHGVWLPLVLMNPAVTRGPSLEVLRRYDGLRVPGVLLDFLRGREPKIRADDLASAGSDRAQGPPPSLAAADVLPLTPSPGSGDLLQQGSRLPYWNRSGPGAGLLYAVRQRPGLSSHNEGRRFTLAATVSCRPMSLFASALPRGGEMSVSKVRRPSLPGG